MDTEIQETEVCSTDGCLAPVFKRGHCIHHSDSRVRKALADEARRRGHVTIEVQYAEHVIQERINR